MRILFRVDATTEIGHGHLFRCLGLAQALKRHGHSVEFFSQINNEDLALLVSADFTFHTNNYLTIKDEINFINQNLTYYDYLILDGYKFYVEYQKLLSLNKTKLVAFDDYVNAEQLADLIINQTPGTDNVLFYKTINNKTRFCIGSQYICLQNKFQSCLNYKRKLTKKVERVLISLGGADHENYTLQVLSFMKQIAVTDLHLTIILGTDYPHYASIQKLSATMTNKIKIIKNCQDMPTEIINSDIAIASSGTLAWELAFLQTPMIIGTTFDNQKYNYNYLINSKSALGIGDYSLLNISDFQAVFGEIINNYQLRLELSTNCSNICDGLGAERIAKILEQL